LRVLLRTFLYGFIFVLIYSATVDLKFGLIAGAGLGLTLAFELGSTRGNGIRLRLRRILLLAALRALFLGIGAVWAFSLSFGSVFALILAYLAGFTPTDEYEAVARPHLSWLKTLGSLIRAILLGFSWIPCHDHSASAGPTS
jgi:hypothetical protein